MSESTETPVAASNPDEPDIAIDEAALGLDKKKKKKPKDKEKEKEKENESEEPTEDKEDKGGEDEDELGLNLKKKKKKKPTAAVEEDTSATPWEGTDRDYAYQELLDRIFSLLRERNPNLAERKRHVMPPPALARIGTRKTMWSNFDQICKTMHRNPDHVMTFVLAELGTEGSIDGNLRLVIKGKFVQRQIESLLKKYIVEYVTCHMCRNPDTTLTRDPITRLYFLQCESCNSRRSVAPIKAGFHATNRTDRRRAGATAH
jgi:translation initiation factor 2 subunit 2